MKAFHISIIIFYFLFFTCVHLSSGQIEFEYDKYSEHPFGSPHPAAPEQLLDFAPLIGICQCQSVSRIDQTSWADTVAMQWQFKYIMNGMAIQDETLKDDDKHAGSIRQFIPDSMRWYVHYYSSANPSTNLPVWEGNKMDNGQIILYRKQKAPNGMEGFYKITFSDISEGGFNWLGEWVNLDETISYPTWKIYCKKKVFNSSHK